MSVSVLKLNDDATTEQRGEFENSLHERQFQFRKNAADGEVYYVVNTGKVKVDVWADVVEVIDVDVKNLPDTYQMCLEPDREEIEEEAEVVSTKTTKLAIVVGLVIAVVALVVILK